MVAFLFTVCWLTALACLYLVFTNGWENYEKSHRKNHEYDVDDGELLNIPDALIAEDKLADIPCEAFWNSRWYEAKIIRQLKLLTGIGKQFCRIYLVEIGTPAVRQWVSADLIRQPSAEQWEPEEYH